MIYFSSLVHALGGRHSLALGLVQGVAGVGAVGERGGALVGVEVSEGVLHPLLVVAVLEVLPGVRA